MITFAAAALASQIALGLEHVHFRTEETPLNRGNILGLEPGADLLRGTASWRGSKGAARGVFRGLVERRLGFGPDDTDFVTREAYVQIGGTIGFLRVGKQRLTWGSGFAWNPTSRLEPPKNPLTTGLEQEGVLAVRGDWSASERATLTLVAARVETRPGELPGAPLDTKRNGGAARLAVVAADTDVAAVLLLREGRSPLYGLDLARGLGGNVVAHAEGALYRKSEMAPVRERTFARLAAGLLYTRGEQAFALEYFHNGEGYDAGERRGWRAALDAPMTSPAYLGAATVGQDGLGLGRDYLHASWTRSQMGGHWSLALRGLVSLTDGGAALTPGVSYTAGGRWTLQTDGFALFGPDDSEYGAAPVRAGLVTRLTVHF